jgi:hypothetical protein
MQAIPLVLHRFAAITDYARNGLVIFIPFAAVVALLVFGTRVQEREQQRRVGEHLQRDLAAIKQGRCEEIFIYEAELLALIAADPQAMANATTLVFSSADFSDPRFAVISKLKLLENVAINSSKNADAMLGYMQGMSSVQKFWIEESPVSKNGLAMLGKLPNLKRVRFEQPLSADEANLLKQLLPKADLRLPYAATNEAG